MKLRVALYMNMQAVPLKLQIIKALQSSLEFKLCKQE